MARKTLKQKRLSDTHYFHYDKKELQIPQTISVSVFALTATYNYLISDLGKTALVTAFILTAQIILFFILKNHLLILPGLSY